MRRAFLAASVLAVLLAVPAAAHAQATPTAGQVTFDNAFIGAEACPSTATGASMSRKVNFKWAGQIDSSATGAGLTSGVFRAYATNQNPTAVTGSTARYCATTNNLNATGGPVYAAQIPPDIANSGGSLSGTGWVITSAVAAAAGGCALANGAAVYVCMHFYPYAPGTSSPQSTPTAWAVGQMTLSTTRPGSVVLSSVLPGNGAVNASWSDPNSPAAAKYSVRALSYTDPATLTPAAFANPSTYTGFDPADPSAHDSGYGTGTGPLRLTGLVNGVTYGVAVLAYSDAETASDPSNILTITPQPVADFWAVYRGAGGQEAGGCSSGLAGPLGLALVAGALALVRRRK